MPSHSVHEDTHTHGLADDCGRCAELASRPWELDDDNLRAFWNRMIVVEFATDSTRPRYRSDTESRLCARFYEMALVLERLGVNPRTIAAVPAWAV
jgi:hypothetical protein